MAEWAVWYERGERERGGRGEAIMTAFTQSVCFCLLLARLPCLGPLSLTLPPALEGGWVRI